jgi:hypothetical protein
MNNVIRVRVNDDVLNTINKLISLDIVKNKTEALNFILNNGIQKAQDTIEIKESARKLLEKYLREELPELPENLSDRSIEERE